MFRLDHVTPDKAKGRIAEIYSLFPPQVGVPEPLAMMSISPELLERQAALINFYMGHPTLSFPLLAAIRFHIAYYAGHKSCAGLNHKLLIAAGMEPEQVEAFKVDTTVAPLEDNERAMLDFVIKAIKTADKVEDADIDSLRKMGWTDKDIYEALFHGASMVASAHVFNALSK